MKDFIIKMYNNILEGIFLIQQWLMTFQIKMENGREENLRKLREIRNKDR